jgi:hypothetical protein
MTKRWFVFLVIIRNKKMAQTIFVVTDRGLQNCKFRATFSRCHRTLACSVMPLRLLLLRRFKFVSGRCWVRIAAGTSAILRGVCGFLQDPWANSEIVPWSCHCRFLANPFQSIIHQLSYYFTLTQSGRPPLWSSGQSSWLQILRSWVRFPALPDFLRSSGSGTGSTQPREDNWGATWTEK